MSGGTKGIAYNQEGIIMFFIFGDFGFEDIIDLYLAKVPVSFDDGHLEEGLELLIGGAHDGGVVLEVDLFARADGVERLHRDVFWISETQSDYIKDHT
jgi:hypothetical protein